ncbi:hypothetical protein DRO55_04555 [Candidatus Bathyarchaeota archaeon]|nr:MAG: hypothetical protein DRO55_04555 [Candidatus Bathyarchaeota archaeon]
MSVKEVASKYIMKTERVLGEVKLTGGVPRLNHDHVRKVLEEAKRYLEDAKFYFDKERFEVSLASVAYCEGLLDALRMLGLAEFEW